MLVNEFLSCSAGRLPEKTALIFDDVEFTYAEIYRQARNLAGYLVDQGLRRGDRVAIYLGNSPEAAVAIFGSLEAGGCFVVINPTVKEEKLTHILDNSGARFIITTEAKTPVLNWAFTHLDQPPAVITCGGEMPTERSLEAVIDTECTGTWAPPLAIDLAAIIYTSGSTGEPKGVTMTHYNMVSAATSITTYLENAEDDIILDMLPFSFDYGLYQFLMAFKIGGTLVLERTFGFPYRMVELIRKYNVTGLPCVPTMFAILLQLEHLEDENLSTVSYISNTAAALPPKYIPRLKKAFPNARIYSMYGLTECKRVSYLPPDIIDRKPDSVGIPMPNTEVWVVDQDGKQLPPGETGELVVRGGSVMKCYWGDPKGTDERLRPGKYPWEKVLHTGDLFRMDDDGYLYFVGRKDDIIKCRGERVSPKEIENVLYGMDEILNARVTGVPDIVYGQAIKAEIVVRNGCQLTEKKVKAYCRKHLEDLLMPKIIAFVESLPISASGKIKRTE